MNNMLGFRFGGGIFVLLLFGSGCNSEAGRPKVQGRIALNGRPLGDKTLCFRSEGAEGNFFTYRVRIQPDGAFSGEVPVAGNYKLAIEESLAVQEGKQPGKDDVVIPAQYKEASTSNLTWDVRKGENKRDFDLTD